MLKRGATVVNFVLLLALLIIGFFVMTSLQRMAFWQGDQLEQDIANSLVEKVYNSIETAKSYPSDTVFEIKLPGIYEYVLTIDRNTIQVNFPKLNKNVTRSYIVNNINVIPSRIENAGEFYVYISKGNLLLDTEHVCDPSNGVCDPGCIVEDFCDKDCYTKETRDICLGSCIDFNEDGRFDRQDADDLCDPDCYNSERNGGVYDFDCLNSDDGICDPDSNFIKDDYCDKDCFPANGICDPDCGDRDVDCYRSGPCDPARKETCGSSYDCRNCTELNFNVPNECKTGCKDFLRPPAVMDQYECVPTSQLTGNNAPCGDDCDCWEHSFCDNGMCCPKGQRNTGTSCEKTVNNGNCDTVVGENCFNAPGDCPCTSPDVCCPLLGNNNNSFGCTFDAGYRKIGIGGSCACSTQCEDTDNTICIGNILDPGTGGGCCNLGEHWNGATCETGINGICEPEIPFYEDCNDADCSCTGGDVCCPEDPESGKDGCTEGGFTNGDECACGNQCNAGLYCSGDVGDKHCCQLTELWNGTDCEDQSTLKILFVPIEMDTPLEPSFDQIEFDNTVTNIVDYLDDKLLDNGGSPIQIDAIKMTKVQYERWKSEISLRTYWDDMCGGALLDLIEIGEWYDKEYPPTRYNYVMGICPMGEEVCNVSDSGTKETYGCAGFLSKASIIKRDPAGSEPDDHTNYRVVAAHELGHNLGLAHVEICLTFAGCFGFNADDCLEPSAVKQYDMMTYCDWPRADYEYGLAAKDYLKQYPLFTQSN